MRIRMLETRRGTEDGHEVRAYIAGEVYELADGLARAFLAAGCAVLPPRRKPHLPGSKRYRVNPPVLTKVDRRILPCAHARPLLRLNKE